MNWPEVLYSEEIMREGFGIATPNIELESRVKLLDALSRTGLKRIAVGAFVSPRYVPQMADFEKLLTSFHPQSGVDYVTFIHNQKAREAAIRFSPPLTVEEEVCTLFQDICDVHQRRNVNRSIEQSMEGWEGIIEDARGKGIKRARVGIASAWGSNFLGGFSQSYRLWSLEQQINALERAGMDVFEIGLHDSQSWCLPHLMDADLRTIKARWPRVKHFHLHMHDARGMALPSIYAALNALDKEDTVHIDGTLGGVGGGQYCGNGIASGMAATEDLLHMLEGMGIETGVDLKKIIECVWMLEEIIKMPVFGHVSKAGLRPNAPEDFYDPNLPAIESLQAARHFKLGSVAYGEDSYSPWRKPISGPWFRGAEKMQNQGTRD